MPLQNRVDPFGELHAVAARGLFMGNRGGKIHTAGKRLTLRRWMSRRWISCVLEFKNRQRDVLGRYYTELFFLDEVTALSAGHRPCFECRRGDAVEFAARWRDAFGLTESPDADTMDLALHGERLDDSAKRTHRAILDDLPDGAMIALDSEAYAVRGISLLHWTPEGYGRKSARPRGMSVDLLTPPSIVAVLRAGYPPRWHPSGQQSTA
jgi:hypothetical protein